jgi:hypothetical protein
MKGMYRHCTARSRRGSVVSTAHTRRLTQPVPQTLLTHNAQDFLDGGDADGGVEDAVFHHGEHAFFQILGFKLPG